VDILSETLRSHNKRLEELKQLIKALEIVTTEYQEEFNKLQKEAIIMNQEIRSGKNLS